MGGASQRPDRPGRALVSGGPGVDARVGFQFTPAVAVDLNVAAHSTIFMGDARVGALVELAPVQGFAVAAGAAVGSMYTVNLVRQTVYGDFAVGVFRAEVRTSLDREVPIAVGGEALVGPRRGGEDVTVGATVVLSFLYR